MFSRKTKLPTSLEEFNSLIDRLCSKYPIKDKLHAAAVVSVAIRHLPNDTCFTTLDYLYQTVEKSLANHIANHVGEKSRHEAQINQLVFMLKDNPNNQQALDDLRKASDQGSEYAKAELAKIDNPHNLQIIKPVS